MKHLAIDDLINYPHKEYFDNISKDMIEKESILLEGFIRHYVLLNAIPKIKMEVTKGKLKWRGIKLCENTHTNEFYVMQRNKQISPKLKIKREVKII